MRSRNIVLNGANELLVSGRGSITFLDFSETSGSAAGHVTLFDSDNGTGQSLGDYRIPEGTTLLNSPRPRGLTYERGVYVNVNSTAIAGLVSVVVCESEADWDALIAWAASLG